ncbi:hypothetical protein [Rhizobium sp. 21-4511-3d]
MNNNGDANRHYQDAMTAQLGERVTNLGRRQSDLESEMRSGFKQMESAVASLSSEMRTSVAALATNIAERNKPQWQAIAVALSFCTIVGGLVYWPIRDATSDLKSSIAIIADKMVTQDELVWRTQRSAEDRARTEASVKDLRDAQVPRAELDRVFAAYDQRFADQQRQINESKEASGSVYGARDVIMDLKTNQQRLERELSDMKSRAGGS